MLREAELYADAKLEHTTLKTVEKTTDISTAVLSWLVIAAIAFLFVLTATTFAIIGLAQVMGSYLYATITISSLYLIILLVFLRYYRRILFKPIKNFLLKEYLESYNHSNG